MSNRRTLGRLRRHRHDGLVVLYYHRVGPVECDPAWLCVTPEHLGEHLEVARSEGWVRSMEDVLRAAKGDRPEGGVAFTFDDGYLDNLTQAKPLLEEHDVPATVFVVAGMVGAEREFWWDELERLLLHPGHLPSSLELEIGGSRHSWNLGDVANYSELDHALHRDWRAGAEPAPTARHKAYWAIHWALLPLAATERDRALAQLRDLAAVPVPADASRRCMSEEQLRDLAAGGLIEIGAHTETHPLLTALTEPDQAAEVRTSITHLRERTDRAVTTFSYPYGAWSPASAEAARAAGTTAAFTTGGASVRRTKDPMRIPRVEMKDVDGDEFARLVRQALRR